MTTAFYPCNGCEATLKVEGLPEYEYYRKHVAGEEEVSLKAFAAAGWGSWKIDGVLYFACPAHTQATTAPTS